MKDITDELTQIKRGAYFLNCTKGVFRGGKHDGQTFSRRFSSETMKVNDVTYYRNGHIEEDKHDQPYIVYRFNENKNQNRTKQLRSSRN